jgi:hypothetical protein
MGMMHAGYESMTALILHFELCSLNRRREPNPSSLYATHSIDFGICGVRMSVRSPSVPQRRSSGLGDSPNRYLVVGRSVTIQ